MRVTQDLLYDSEATLRLVDRALEDLHMTDRSSFIRGASGYRTEQLRGEPGESEAPATNFLRAYWEIQDALELLRDSHAALQSPAAAPRTTQRDEHDRLNRALAMVDQLQGEDADPRRGQAHDALREELLALAAHLRSREAVSDRLDFTSDLLLDLELRLDQLARVLDAGHRGSVM